MPLTRLISHLFRVHEFHSHKISNEQGFTLIELMVSMAMGLVLIAGLSSIFIADSKTSRVISSRTERMGDLFLASHLMQEALRESLSTPDPTKSILTDLTINRSVSLPTGYPTSDSTFTSLPFWDASSKTLTYQDLEGHVGIFQYQRTSNDRIYWLRPLAASASGSSTFQELMREMDTTNGMLVYDPTTNNLITTTLGGGLRVDLKSAYVNTNNQGSTLSLSLLAWPRN